VTSPPTAADYHRLVAEHASDIVCVADAAGRVHWVSSTVERVLGWDSADLIGHTLAEFTHPDDQLATSIVRDTMYALTGTDPSPNTSFVRVRAKSGDFRWMCGVGRRLVDGGQPNGTVTSLRDVHEIIVARTDAERAADTLRVILNATPDAIASFDRTLHVRHVNDHFAAAMRRSPEECVGRTLSDLGVGLELTSRFETQVLATFADATVRHIEVDFDDDGNHRWLESRCAPVMSPCGTVEHVILCNRDVTVRHLAEDELRLRAMRDQLTGLANRAALIDEIGRALSAARRSGRSAAVLMIDLDHFKYVNDSLGHGVGDQLLVAAAARLVCSVRAHDLVARLGGDEFVVVMRDLEHPLDVMMQAQRIVEQFRLPLTVCGTDLYTTASIGVATSTIDSEPGDLLRESDTALYVAKELGRDRVAAFTAALRAAVTHRLDLSAKLRPALERAEFEVWYQPEVDLASGDVVAVEALLRWHTDDGELHTADRFIDVAEETGVLPDIGDWVLFQACRHTATWNRAMSGPPLTLRVNLSANQLAEPRLLLTLDDALTNSGLDPNLLCLEITESALLRENPTATDNLAAIHGRGMRLSIDDFGTGYASLSYLRDLPIDVIKIDRSFIANIDTEERDHRIVGGIIALAAQLGITVTAEGVEHDAQSHVLRSIRCTAAQGYHFARPMPAGDIPWFVQQQRAGLVQR
jgi:diguanylate cyclase (GGDEF)-like protein/PAS domain S-box-containing protein